MGRFATVLLVLCVSATAQELSRFGAGNGPSRDGEVLHLLDKARTPGQSNAAAFDQALAGDVWQVRCRLRVLEGGDGGAFVFLNTAEYGARGPAPFVKSWVEPNLKGTFAVGIDVHDPPNSEPFGPWGNVLELPEREVSLHWDGREIVKRLAPEEFRGDFADCAIDVRFVTGGAEVTVKLGPGVVYDRYLVAGMLPYEARLAIGAGTRADATTEFDVKDLRVEAPVPLTPRRPPLHFEVFNHVLTDNKTTAYEADVDLPPAEWAFGRVLLTLEIHDAGPNWDEWDRCGEVSVWDADGQKRGIVPFITSYRTPCHWVVDVTHFRPLLAGKTRFEVSAGTTFYKNRGYMMSVALDYYPGTPDFVPFRVVPLWHGTAHYRSGENHFRDFFEPRSVAIDAVTKAARIWTTTTGHSQVGEFTPSRRAIVLGDHRFENTLWKTDCYLNPNRPQFGTWKYPRAGWAPGDVVRPWWIDLTEFLEPGTTVELRYEPQPYEFTSAEGRPSDKDIADASHIVRSYLILYRDPAGLMAPPALLVTGVADKSNAAKAGLKAGDWLATYDGAPLETVDDLRTAIQAAAGKQSVKVTAYRGTERIEVEMPPGTMGVNLAVR